MSIKLLHMPILALAASLAFVSAPPFVMAKPQKATASAKQDTKEESKVDIEADSMEIQDEKNTAIFTGNVKAVRDKSTLYADKMVVHYKKVRNEDGSEKTEVTDFVATGNVRIVDPDQTITGNKARMDVKKDLLWVTGNVTVKTSTSTIYGTKLFTNRKTGITHIESEGKERVRGTFIE